MERRRNRPEKYDRELVQKTVKAMEKITEVCIFSSCRYCARSSSGCDLSSSCQGELNFSHMNPFSAGAAKAAGKVL
jgi:hypothetical protein